MGEHVFRTYHSNASLIIGSAQAMEADSAKAMTRRLATVKRLAPAIVGEDEEYTHLLMIIASTYRERGNRKQAVSWTERAVRIAPSDLNLALWLADYYLWAGRADTARRCIDAILERDPRNLNALI